jgi:hypothetical protein
MGASECLMAAMELDRGFSDRTGEYIVTFHAIELGLKAFLIKCGVPEWGLREKPYGHDLVCLYNMAKQRGLLSALRMSTRCSLGLMNGIIVA